MGYRRLIGERNHRKQRTKRRAVNYRTANSQCLKKMVYISLREAERIADKASSERGAKIRAYECPFCGRYHLTAKKRIGGS